MKSVSILSLLLSLALLLSLTAAKSATPPATAPAAAPTKAPCANFVSQACQNATKKALCVSVLNSDPTSKNADLKGLAFIALKKAANNAANTSTHIKSLLNKGSIEDPELEDSLTGCAQSYVDVVDQIQDSVDALVNKNFKNVNAWVKAAIADVATCNGSLKSQSSSKAKELVGKNTLVHDLCKNALEVVRVLHHSSHK